MKRLCALIASLSLFMAACGQTTKDERTRQKTKSTDTPREASDEQEETPSIDPVDPVDVPGGAPLKTPTADVPANDDSNAPTTDPVVPTPPPIKWDNGVPVATTKALDAALKGMGVDTILPVYGYKWRIALAAVSRDGNTITISGMFKHSDWWIDDKISYEFRYVDGKLESSDIFIDDTQSPFVIVGPILTAVGLAYGVPIPMNAVSDIAIQIEKMVVGNWEGAAQKLALRIGMEGYRQASLHD